MNQEIGVDGMTCARCAGHVEKALLALDGVRAVTVDLAARRVVVESDREVGRDEFANAIDRAGYALR
jgi:copper chaperone CopZ